MAKKNLSLVGAKRIALKTLGNSKHDTEVRVLYNAPSGSRTPVRGYRVTDDAFPGHE